MKMTTKRPAKKNAAAAAKRKPSSSRMAASNFSSSGISVIRAPKPRPKVNPADVLDAQHTSIAYSVGRSDPFSMYFGGILSNPDPVLPKVGMSEQFYDDLLIRHPYVAGILDQKIDRANTPRSIVAGDPTDSRSIQLAEEARRHWRKVQNSQVVLARALRNANFIGYGPIEKVFTRDPQSGLVYVCRMIDRKCANVRFRDDGTAVWLSRLSPILGEDIPRRKMLILRSGSLNTGYGDGEGRQIYPATYLIEKAVELALDSIEEFGRPIPVVYMPRAKEILTEPEREKIRSYARAVHSRFIEIPTTEMKATIDMTGSASLAASGSIGRPEMAVVEMLITWIYVRILRVMQTQNKSGGSRNLETVRYEITDDASRPLCTLLDGGLNAPSVIGDEYTGWMADFNDFNFPNEPDETLPRFETPTLSQEAIAAIHSRVMDDIDHGIGEDISKDWYMRVTGAEKAKSAADRLGGVPKTQIREVVPESSPTAPPETPKSLADVVELANELARNLDHLAGVAA